MRGAPLGNEIRNEKVEGSIPFTGTITFSYISRGLYNSDRGRRNPAHAHLLCLRRRAWLQLLAGRVIRIEERGDCAAMSRPGPHCARH